MKKDAIPLHSMTIEHPSKQRKLNRVGKIFLDLFELHKYNLITTIPFMVNDVEDSQSLQSNVLINLGFPCCLFMKPIVKHSVDCLLQTI